MKRNSKLLALLLLCGCLLLALLAPSCGRPRIARLTVIVSGYGMGYLKNCGCSGAQVGGEVRKARIVKAERELALAPKPADKARPAEALLVDLGNFTDGSNEITKIQSAGVIQSMALCGYESVGLGKRELSMAQDDLLKLLKRGELPYTAANLSFVAPATGVDASSELNGIFKPYRVVTTKSGYRIGIIHAIDAFIADSLGKSNGFELSDPAGAVEGVLSSHKKEADAWIVTLADVERGSTKPESFKQHPQLLSVIGFPRENPLESGQESIADGPYMSEPPFDRFKDVLRLTLSYDMNGKAAAGFAEHIAVAANISPDEETEKIIVQLEPELEKAQIKIDEETAQLPGKHPYYVGHLECAKCHNAIAQQMEASAHARAYESLVGKSQHRSAACLPCHVVGYGQPSGWNILHNPPLMQGVQCENCHGPGEYHVMLENKQPAPPDLQAEGRDAHGLQPANKAGCVVCHNTVNSENFNFDTYWPKIKH